MKVYLKIFCIALCLLGLFCNKGTADNYTQNFDSNWSCAPTTPLPQLPTLAWGDYWSDDYAWEVFEGIIETNAETYLPDPASWLNAVWLRDLSTASSSPYILGPVLSNGVGTVYVACQSTEGENVFTVETAPEATPNTWTIHGSITNSSVGTWETNSLVVNLNQSCYLRFVKTYDTGEANSYLGIDDINVTLPPSYVVITNVLLSPAPQTVSSQTFVSSTITSVGFISNIVAKTYYSINDGASFSPISMVTTGASYYFTDPSSIPNPSTPGSKVYYYIKVTFTGVYDTPATNYWPSTAPTNNASFIVRRQPFSSIYTNVQVRGSTSTNMILTSNNQWQAVTTTTNMVNPVFYFLANGTNWGDAIQSVSNLSVYGRLTAGDSDIYISGSATNHQCFLYNEISTNYSIENCAFADFTGWAATATNFGTYTNSEGWIISGGRLNRADETDISFSNNSCILSYDQGTEQFARSTNLSNGIGMVSFWYRNYASSASPPAGLTVQKSVDATTWHDVAQVTNIISVDYTYFSYVIGSPDYHYIRVLNNTNAPSPYSQVCLDEIVITEPKAIVTLTNSVIDPAMPSGEYPVAVSIEQTATNGASNLLCRVYYRAPSSTVFDSSLMTPSSNKFTGTIPPCSPGQLDYYFECTYDGFRAGPASYPAEAPYSFLSYTNDASGQSTRVQNFDSNWSSAPSSPAPPTWVWGDYGNDDWTWFVSQGMIEDNASDWISPAASFPYAAWLMDYANSPVNPPYIMGPEMTNGIGAIYFKSQSLTLGTNIISVETSVNGTDWQVQCFVTNETVGSWVDNSVTLNAYTSLYVRLVKTNDYGISGQYLGIDDIVISPPPADVVITDISYAPGYPSASESVTIMATITSLNTNFPAFAFAPKVCFKPDSASSTWQTNSMAWAGGDRYAGTIPPLPTGNVLYYIRCDFDGYYYTNSTISEKASPAFAPDAPSTSELPDQFYSYPVRRFISSYGSLVVTGNIGSVSMIQSADNEWQGAWQYTNMATQLSFIFAGFQQYTGSVYSSETNVFGDSDQVNFTLPQASYGDLSTNPIVINMNVGYYGAVTFRINTTNNFYVIRRGVYQDFNSWIASVEFFEESLDLYGINTITNNFDSWPTNVTYVNTAGNGMEDFESSPLTNEFIQWGTYYPNFQNPTTNWWCLDRVAILPEASANHIGVLDSQPGYGMVIGDRVRRTDGLKTFSFDYRVTSTDHFHTIYSPTPAVAWTNSEVEAYLRCTNTSPGFSSVSIFARLLEANNYYEYRLERYSLSQLKLSLLRKASGQLTSLSNVILTGTITNQIHKCRLLTVTNDTGSVYLEAYYNGELKVFYYDTDVTALNKAGTVGFLTREADILVDSVAVRNTDVQRFYGWNTASNGTWTNTGWIVNDGRVTNSGGGYCILSAKTNTQNSSENFETWSAPGWGTYTNANQWVLTDGYITSSLGAYSPSRSAWLGNDGGLNTNSYLRTLYFTNSVDTLSFSCKNTYTNSIQFKVETSTDATNWATFCTLTNTDNSFWYTHKAKIRFKGYNKNETLTNFPVFVALNSNNITGFNPADFTTTNAADLRFANSNETQALNYEIDTWNNGTVISPLDISNCAFWVKADAGVAVSGGYVTNWLDQSGNNRHLNNRYGNSTLTNNLQNLNKQSAVTFNGSSYLHTTYNFDSLKKYTIMSVTRYNASDYRKRVVASRDRNYLFGLYNGQDACFHAEGWIYQGGSGNTNWHMHTGTSNDDPDPKADFWTDGVLLARKATGSGNLNYMIGRLELAGVWGTGDQSKCQVAEVLIYSRVLEPDEINQLHMYLSKKYGLGATTGFGSDEAQVWVQVPEISSTNSYIWAYWGGTGLAAPPCTTNGSTWSQDYEAVWHMNQPDTIDSAAKGYNATSYGTFTLGGHGGIIGSAQRFDGNTEYIDVPEGMAYFPAMTISFWAIPTSRKNWARFVDFGKGAGVSDNDIIITRDGTSTSLRYEIYPGDGTPVNVSGVLADNQWQHFTATLSTNKQAYVYKNGVKQAASDAILNIPNNIRRLNNYIGRSYSSADQYYQGSMDEMRMSTIDRSSNWIWTTWYNVASNNAFCEYSTNMTVSGSLTNWNTYQVGPLPSTAKYARIFKNQATETGRWLGIDSVSALSRTPNITSPYLSYSPSRIMFDFYLPGAGTNVAQIKLTASTDGNNWTTLYGPFAAKPNAWYTYDSAPFGNRCYYRIENVSSITNAYIRNIYITEAGDSYGTSFENDASDWIEPLGSGKWTYNSSQQAWTRKGYPDSSLGFIIETNYYEGIDEIDFPASTWGSIGTGSSSNLNWQHAQFDIFSWTSTYARIRHTSGSGNLVLDNLSFSSWRDTVSLSDNGWFAQEVWVAPYDSIETNDHVVEFWKSKANPANFQGITTPLMTNGIGMLSFDYKVANGPVDFIIQHTKPGHTGDWETISNSITTAYNTSWKPFLLPFNESSTQYVRLVHTSDKPLVTYLTYEYYTYAGSWNSLPNFDYLTPDKSGPCTNFTYSQIEEITSGSTNFAFRWTGKINLPYQGIWHFSTRTDDGSKLYIDGSEVVNNDGGHGALSKTGSVNIAVAGWHDIQATYYQGTGIWTWQTPKYAGPNDADLQDIPNSALIYAGNGPVLYVNNIQLSEYRKRDEKMWWAYNALITSNQTDRIFEERTCFLNNSPSDGTRPGSVLTNFMPCVQTPEMQGGIGEINFWYRRWDSSGTNASKIYVTATTNYLTADSNCSPLFVLSDITNTEYRYFSTNFFITTNYFLRISGDTNTAISRFCIDNIGVFEPASANLQIDNVILLPEQPLYTNTVNVRATLKNFVFNPSNIDVRLYYYAGTNSWATNWPATNYIPLNVVYASNAYERILTSSSFIPAFGIDTVVQYHVSCSFDGWFAEHASPKVHTNFTNPSWYTPVNLNSNKPASTPYYFVYSCPTGSAWINEVNPMRTAWEETNEYVEICAKAGSKLYNWSIELLGVGEDLKGIGWITNNWNIANEANGVGFVVWGDSTVESVDVAFTNLINPNIEPNGAIRLVRSMGAWEHKVCYGNAEALTNFGYQFIYSGKSFTSRSSYMLQGTGSNLSDFTWTYIPLTDEYYYTPGYANTNQTFTGNEPPFVASITISNFWREGTNLYISFVTTATNDILPYPWYCTNLIYTNWLPVPAPIYTNYYQLTGVYTQQFTLMTNMPTYFFKIVSTNAP